MEYIIFIRKRKGGGRYIAFFDSGYFHYDGNKCIHQKDVKRSYLKKK